MGSAVDDCSAPKCRPRHLCRPATDGGIVHAKVFSDLAQGVSVE